jgi:hypothetical protein
MTDEFLTNLQNLTTFDARELHLHPALLHRQGNGVIQDWREPTKEANLQFSFLFTSKPSKIAMGSLTASRSPAGFATQANALLRKNLCFQVLLLLAQFLRSIICYVLGRSDATFRASSFLALPLDLVVFLLCCRRGT